MWSKTAAKGRGRGGGGGKSTAKTAVSRIMSDLSGVENLDYGRVEMPNKDNPLELVIYISPLSGLWSGATYKFNCSVPETYPYDPPKVICETKVYHPNIDLQGNVCLNILRKEWNPVNDLYAVAFGLLFLFYEPNPEDPLNREAGMELLNDKSSFEENVKKSLKGRSLQINGEMVQFPKLL